MAQFHKIMSKAKEQGLTRMETVIDHEIIGPAFVQPPPAELSDFYPCDKSEPLPFAKSSITYSPSWSSKTFPAWPRRHDDWVAWVEGLKPKLKDHWEKLNIWRFIQLTAMDFQYDRHLLIAALLFWNRGYNFFHFGCGPMAPTLFDIAALTGLPVLGRSISANIASDDFKVPFSDKGASKTFLQFLRAERQSTGTPTNHEHTAFLLYLICRYIVCLSGKNIAKELIPLARLEHLHLAGKWP